MKRTELCTFVLVLALAVVSASVAQGARNAGGALVIHASNLTFQYRVDFCSSYPLPPICQDLNTETDLDPSLPAIFWVVAAFPTNSSPGVTAYQFGIYGDIPLEYYYSWSPCGPGWLEIPDATWPSPGTGTAVAYGSPVYEGLFKVYWFAVSAPGPGAALSTGPYPHGPMHAQFADDSTPAQIDDCFNFGTMRWGVPGDNHCPQNLPTTGACCYPDGRCALRTEVDCASGGGAYQGDGAPCDPFPCPVACCFQDESCRDLTEEECASAGGTSMGPGSVCSADPCAPSPTRSTTWGRIKGAYR